MPGVKKLRKSGYTQEELQAKKEAVSKHSSKREKLEKYHIQGEDRIYLQPGEEAPKGVALFTGGKGGKFYYPKPQAAESKQRFHSHAGARTPHAVGDTHEDIAPMDQKDFEDRPEGADAADDEKYPKGMTRDEIIGEHMDEIAKYGGTLDTVNEKPWFEKLNVKVNPSSRLKFGKTQEIDADQYSHPEMGTAYIYDRGSGPTVYLVNDKKQQNFGKERDAVKFVQDYFEGKLKKSVMKSLDRFIAKAEAVNKLESLLEKKTNL